MKENEQTKKVLIIKYNDTDADIITENGRFGYFYGADGFLTFEE